MIAHDMDFPSLPEDIICEIFGLLDTEALKYCSLTSKGLSSPAKQLIHRTLHLTPRPGAPTGFNVPGRRNELEGLAVLGERGLLQHTRRVLIFLPYSNPLLARDLQPHIQHLRTLTSVRSLEIRWLDIPSFIPKIEGYLGAFFGTLRSLELECPSGDDKQIFHFVCHFRNLRDQIGRAHV